jgi:hypothetical protein
MAAHKHAPFVDGTVCTFHDTVVDIVGTPEALELDDLIVREWLPIAPKRVHGRHWQTDWDDDWHADGTCGAPPAARFAFASGRATRAYSAADRPTPMHRVVRWHGTRHSCRRGGTCSSRPSWGRWAREPLMADDTKTDDEITAELIELWPRLTPFQRRAFMYSMLLDVTENTRPTKEGAAEQKRMRKALEQYLRDRREFPVPPVQ